MKPTVPAGRSALLARTLVWKCRDSTLLTEPGSRESEGLALSWARRGSGRPGLRQRACVWTGTQHSGRASVWALPETDQLWVRRMGNWERPRHRFLSCSFLPCFSFINLTRVFRKPEGVGKAASYLPPLEKQTFALTHSPWSSPAHLFCQLPRPLPVQLSRANRAESRQRFPELGQMLWAVGR